MKDEEYRKAAEAQAKYKDKDPDKTDQYNQDKRKQQNLIMQLKK
ncbi:MAG: hypothetical protein U9532_01125 ['Conium maculatum' witches'-broom phytoplasma]|nr:hypothetical protein ['Conium maculatum' witches'-broom phytoplasma]